MGLSLCSLQIILRSCNSILPHTAEEKMPLLKSLADKTPISWAWPEPPMQACGQSQGPHMFWSMPDLPSHDTTPPNLALPQASLLQEEREAQGHPSLNLCGLPELHKAHQLASLIINHTVVSALTSQFTAGHTPCHCRMPILMNKWST